jgi:tetratricopeptide (TPR) repeat protein
MYKYFLLIFFISIKINSQINPQLLSNHWTRVKVRTADGSKVLTELDSRFFQWKLTNNKLCEILNPILLDNQKCIDYQFENNFISTYPLSGYKIEKLDNDSLIVTEKLNGVSAPDKLKKYWFVKTSNIEKDYIEKNKNEKIITADKYFTPTLNKNIVEEILNKYNEKNYYPNFKLMGNIIIYPKNEKIEVEVLNKEELKNDSKYVEVIKSIIENSYASWSLVRFKNFEKVYIPFTINSKSGKAEKYNSIGFVYFTNNMTGIAEPMKSKRDIFLSKKTFNNGLIALQDKKYEKAINLFGEAYEQDDKNIDALYNIAAVYGIMDDSKNACIALKKLKDLGQTEATKIFNEKCSK